MVAVDRADAADLQDRRGVAGSPGAPGDVHIRRRATSNRCSPRAFGTDFRAETELAVDNRAVVEALAAHCERLGVQWAPPVDDLADAGRRRSW